MEKVIKDHKKLLQVIERLKSQGKKIVLTNGCFDLIHVGHIRCLKAAKQKGDILIVAVNSDSSSERIKEKGRPVTPEEERLEILSAIECIDYLTLFSESTVDKLITLLKPDIFAKGTDYTIENVPERDTALSIGAQIAIVGDPKKHSSSELIKTIYKINKK